MATDLEEWRAFLGKYQVAVTEPTRSVFFPDNHTSNAILSDVIALSRPPTVIPEPRIQLHFDAKSGKFLGVDIDEG